MHSAVLARAIPYVHPSVCLSVGQTPVLCPDGLKSDVTIVFLDPDFLEDAKISAIRVHLRQIYFYLIFAWVFRTSWLKM